jgi:hypothetical protein
MPHAQWSLHDAPAGITSTKDPFLAALQRSFAHPSAWEDALYILDGELCMGDVSVIHPAAPNYRLTAAATAGAHRDAAKRAQHAQHGAVGNALSPRPSDDWTSPSWAPNWGTPLNCAATVTLPRGIW